MSQAGAEVDTIATELVPQLQKHTEQLTNVFALIDKMHDHLELVKDSGTLLSPPTYRYCLHPCIHRWNRAGGRARVRACIPGCMHLCVCVRMPSRRGWRLLRLIMKIPNKPLMRGRRGTRAAHVDNNK
jgi:hypothetical protein